MRRLPSAPYHQDMDESTSPAPVACGKCRGPLSAAHMLTKSYEIDRSGHWERILSDFPEDVVVVCHVCGTQQDGRIDDDGPRFVFSPESTSQAT